MHSPAPDLRDLDRLRATALAALLACGPAAAWAQPGAAAATSAVPAARATTGASAVEAAASALRASGDFGGTRIERTWRLVSDDTERPPPARHADSSFADFVRWLAEQMRVLVWLAGAFALAALLVLARRWWRVRGAALPVRARPLPQHVRELDIRPESLPDDIGAAARALWLAGERRGALALLYRGALSRLVHAHALPIQDSSTEDDCVRLARRGLAEAPAGFVARLVRAWQVAVYGGRPLADETVLALCDDFGRHLPARAS